MVRDAARLREFHPAFTRQELLEMGPVLAGFLYRH
jgi:hypothetical protein